MQYLANVLTLYNANLGDKTNVEALLNANGCPFVLIDSTFFFGTSTAAQSGGIKTTMAASPLQFSFLFMRYNNNCWFDGGGIDPVKLERINQIFFEDI